MTLTTTLAKIGKNKPDKKGWMKLCKSLGGIKKYGEHTPIKFSQIVESNGLNEALLCLYSVSSEYDKDIRLLAADYAERVLYIFEREYPEDERPRHLIQATRDFANGLITKDQLDTFKAAAKVANWAVNDAAKAAAMAAVRLVAKGNTEAATWAVARAATWAVARSAGSYTDIDKDTWVAAWVAEREAQTKLLIERFG